ncbi:hypothetical protein PRECH8_12340 [Insulibacter thermoxylanivorax]|uniref:Uncharacterized protein n=1 Tax=Insulibacter thermoxylanivorax TaxID=2749268 RepID=A0A916QF57_9BACL|nr:hypothetical protein PRECH8_12340 [Insulibacter thermoxylanivorax]
MIRSCHFSYDDAGSDFFALMSNAAAVRCGADDGLEEKMSEMTLPSAGTSTVEASYGV